MPTDQREGGERTLPPKSRSRVAENDKGEKGSWWWCDHKQAEAKAGGRGESGRRVERKRARRRLKTRYKRLCRRKARAGQTRK